MASRNRAIPCSWMEGERKTQKYGETLLKNGSPQTLPTRGAPPWQCTLCGSAWVNEPIGSKQHRVTVIG